MYSICKLKNISGSVTTLQGHEFQIDELYQIPDNLRISWASSDSVLSAIYDEDFEVHDDYGQIEGISNQLDWLKTYIPKTVDVASTPPFSEPTHRTKFTAASNIETVAANSSENLDYQVTSERYVYGGSLIVENAEVGDYISACIYDKDSVIPEAYREALCENWPIVATYIEKHFLSVSGVCNTYDEINTYPLNAKITAGLYMRIVYTAVDSGSTRNIGVNYRMAKKL